MASQENADDKKPEMDDKPSIPGNNTAARIRNYYYNSTGRILPPNTAGTSPETRTAHRNARFVSMYDRDFNEADESGTKKVFPADIQPRQDNDFEDASIFVKRKNDKACPSPKDMFMNWNIPSRLSEHPEEQTSRMVTPAAPKIPGPRLEACSPPATQMSRRSGYLPPVRQPPNSHTPPRSPVRSVTSPCRSAVPPPYVRQTPNKGFDLRKDLTMADFRPKTLQQTIQPTSVPLAEQWLQTANESERRVIEKALRLAQQEDKHKEAVLNKALLPGAKKEVDKWMTHASQREKNVALKFFGSVAGQQMGQDGQNDRVKQVLAKLEQARPNAVPQNQLCQSDEFKMEGDGNLKYVRLLSPETRKNKWLHHSWHHMPPVKNQGAYNPRAILTQPHRMIPRHFRIHPDWGEN